MAYNIPLFFFYLVELRKNTSLWRFNCMGGHLVENFLSVQSFGNFSLVDLAFGETECKKG